MPAVDLTVTLTLDPDLVFRRVAGWLAADPIGTNVFGTALAAARSGARAGGPVPDGVFWALVDVAGPDGEPQPSGSGLLGAALHTPPRPLYLPPMPDRAAAALARAVHRSGREVPGVAGAVGPTAAFTRTWRRLTGRTAWRTGRQGTLVLDGEPVPPTGVPGAARPADPADPADVDLAVAWLARSEVEVHGRDRAPVPGREAMARELSGGRMLVWQVGTEPVSLAGWRPPASGVSRIGPVYTPPEHRGHGYAAAVTTAATRAARRAGASRVMLFTDLANPVSNRVYRRLGYRQVGEMQEWSFGSPAQAPTPGADGVALAARARRSASR
jgi:GNAT superfamily N-acetyltransferase